MSLMTDDIYSNYLLSHPPSPRPHFLHLPQSGSASHCLSSDTSTWSAAVHVWRCRVTSHLFLCPFHPPRRRHRQTAQLSQASEFDESNRRYFHSPIIIIINVTLPTCLLFPFVSVCGGQWCGIHTWICWMVLSMYCIPSRVIIQFTSNAIIFCLQFGTYSVLLFFLLAVLFE